MNYPYYFVFDVESVGLYGPAFAVGFVVIDASDAKEVWRGLYVCELPCHGYGPYSDDEIWVAKNVPKMPINCMCPHVMREAFWEKWMEWKTKGAVMVADCPFPVETKFLTECVLYGREDQKWNGPYPLIDVASVVAALGGDPLKVNERIDGEKTIHNPLCDARQSARILVEHIRNQP